MTPTGERRLVVGVSGGSGIPYALDLLRALHTLDMETHLIVSSGAKARGICCAYLLLCKLFAAFVSATKKIFPIHKK